MGAENRVKFLVRKVARGKWETTPFADGEIPADTLTSELKTQGNTLSFWESEGEDDSLWKEVALALAASGERIDRLDVAWLERTTLSDNGIALEKTPGKTPVLDLRDRHVDAAKLDVMRLVRVSHLLAQAIRVHKKVRRLARSEVINLLVEGARAGRMKLEDLKPLVREEVETKLHEK